MGRKSGSGTHDQALTNTDRNLTLTFFYSDRNTSGTHDHDLTSISYENVSTVKKVVNYRRKRDREPFRVPVKKNLTGLRKRNCRGRIQSFIRQHVPRTSFISNLCQSYKRWHLYLSVDHFFSKYVFLHEHIEIYKTRVKCCSRQATKNLPQTCINLNVKTNSFPQSCNIKHFTLKGGMAPNTTVSYDTPLDCLTERLALIGLKPHDVGGSGDCFFKSVSHQLYGVADLHFEVRMAGIGHLSNYP